MYNRDMESSVESFASKHSGDARTPILQRIADETQRKI